MNPSEIEFIVSGVVTIVVFVAFMYFVSKDE